MAFRISGAAIRNPIPPLVLFAVLTLLGVVAFMMLPVTRAPNIDVPVVSVTVLQPGAAAGELESQVTKKIEDAVAAVQGVKHIQSSVHRRQQPDGDRDATRGRRRPRGQRRARRGGEDPHRPAARHRRADHRARRRGWSEHPNLRRQCARPNARKAVVLHRRRGRARPAGRRWRRAHRADRRRHPRDTGADGPRPAGGAGRHRRRRERGTGEHQCRPFGRARRGRHAGAGDPHAGQRAHRRRPRGHPHRAAGRARGAAVRRRDPVGRL